MNCTRFDFEAYRESLAQMHDHICPRQILGLRMGLYGAALLNFTVPQTGKHLLAFVETNGCFADGIAVATGCTLGHRTLYLMDYGKVAITLVDTQTGQAVRVAPHQESRRRALEACPDTRSHWHAYLEAYQILDDEALLVAQPVTLNLALDRLISQPGRRVVCEGCGEEILNEREVRVGDTLLCRACAGEAYYLPTHLRVPAEG
ncbi:MAG TPA: FmdE family protein [Aggregatilineaceae bacterium]|nr:FmdE family protein [Aggregatilineaceae bacterium]